MYFLLRTGRSSAEASPSWLYRLLNIIQAIIATFIFISRLFCRCRAKLGEGEPFFAELRPVVIITIIDNNAINDTIIIIIIRAKLGRGEPFPKTLNPNP